MSAVPDNRQRHHSPETEAAVSARASRVQRPAAESIRLRTEVLQQKLLCQRQATVIAMLAKSLDATSLDEALMALANGLQTRFRCSRVMIALCQKDRLRVHAVSQHDSVEASSSEICLAEDVMQAAVDADRLLQHTGAEPAENMPAALETWLMQREQRQVCVLPLVVADQMIGAMLLETEGRGRWEESTTALVSQLAFALSPIIALRQRAEKGIVQRCRDALRAAVVALGAPQHLVFKVAFGLGASLLLLAALIPIQHRVAAEAQLVASERRLMVAPRAGLIEGVMVKTGDRVVAGEPLLTLDTGELELEVQAWQNKRGELEGQIRAAMATADRQELAKLMAQQQQIDAELALVEHRLERSNLIAPMDGIVIQGDLSQALGAVVERGDTLVEIAPDKAYAVHLLVDERDIRFVESGQQGVLSLASEPGEEHHYRIDTIHPLSQPAEGKNRFRVEATLLEPDTSLRAGQSGRGKVVVGRASLLWLTTHRFTDWFRQKLWEAGL